MSETLNYHTVKRSRKIHVCEWCGGNIEEGASYKKWTYMEDGDVTTMRAHIECMDAFDELSAYEQEETYFNRDQPRGCNCGFDPLCERCHPKMEE